jgi:hypothetical protein
MKNNYILVTIEENKKYYSYVVKAPENENLLSILKIKNIIAANIYPSKRQAGSDAIKNNNIYKKNNSFLFDNPSF